MKCKPSNFIDKYPYASSTTTKKGRAELGCNTTYSIERYIFHFHFYTKVLQTQYSTCTVTFNMMIYFTFFCTNNMRLDIRHHKFSTCFIALLNTNMEDS